MKAQLTYTLALLAATLVAANAQRPKLHKFTDVTGRTLVAGIQSVEDGKVIGLLKNGKTVKIPIASLSAEDVKYVSDWGRRNFTVKLAFEPELKKSEVTWVEHLVETAEDWEVKLSLSNTTGIDLEDLTIAYAVATDYAERWRVIGGRSTESFNKIQCHPGSVKLAKLPSSKEPTEVKTALVGLLQAEQKRNPNISGKLSRSSYKQAEAIAGVWVAIYDKYGKKLWEEYPGDDKAKEEMKEAMKTEIGKLERKIVRKGERLASKVDPEATPDTES